MLVRYSRSFFQATMQAVMIAALLLAQVQPVFAGLIPKPKVPNANDFAADVEKRYHIDTESVQEQGETINVSNNKKMTPEVSLFFSPSDPKEGETLSAQAFPIYFSTEPRQMYFTWYLQRKNCLKRSGPLDTKELRDCDLDSDGNIDEEDWKIEAARIIANDGFDTSFVNYSAGTSDPDDDGYKARFGGDNKVNTEAHCYYHDNETGENYEIVGDASDPVYGCTESRTPVCMEASQEINFETIGVPNNGLASGLSVYYRYDDGTGTTATDTSGNELNGTLTNSPQWTSGKINSALDFDGTNDYVVTPDDDGLEVGDSANFTLSGWFNRDTFAADHTLLAKSDGQSAAESGYLVFIDDTTDRLVFKASDGTDQYTLESTSTFTSTGWNHYTLVWNDASGATLYINGTAEAGTATGTFANVGSLANSEDLYAGTESDQGNPFDGKLDEIRGYGRALSSSEVSALYALTEPTTVTDPVTEGDSYVTGFPYCSRSNVTSCVKGTPCCVSNSTTATACEQNITGSTCSVSTTAGSCKHLFPVSGIDESGNGKFTTAEEKFWGTDPKDPDTADNGNKDEANVIGLGQQNFSWSYAKGDKVGVVVEGTSMFSTKYKDSSNMIMWAFSKNNCDAAGNKGVMQKSIKGYEVKIPTVEIDLNDCLEANLVDPLEGGQATKIEMSLQATPDDPLNDSSTRGSGDTLQVIATVNNAANSIKNVYFDWKVYLSSNGTISPPVDGGWKDITASLNSFTDGRKLLSTVKGNGIDRLRLALNIQANDRLEGKLFSEYTTNGVGYLRFRAEAAENFSARGDNRRGHAEVIVKFISTSDRIGAYLVDVVETDPNSPARLQLRQTSSEPVEICSGNPNLTAEERLDETKKTEKTILSKLDTKLCRVIPYEIIGLKIDSSDTLSNFNWSINGLPLICNSKVSAACKDEKQGNTNFFPIIGNVGDVFTVTVTANKVEHTSVNALTNPNFSTEKVVTLSRAFKIVEPEVVIESADLDLAWPKVLGRYNDPSGKAYIDFSKTTLQAFSGSQVKLQARFTPDFLGSYDPPQIERAWTVDGDVVGNGASNQIAFSTLKPPESIYNINLNAVYRPRSEVRRALQDIWQISALETTEKYFSTATQLEHPAETTIAKTGVNKYLALASSYLPTSLLFGIRVFLSIGLILFVTGFMFSLIPNVPPRPERYGRKREDYS